MSSQKPSETWISRAVGVVGRCPVCDGEWYEHAEDCPEAEAKPPGLSGELEEFVLGLTGAPIDTRYKRKGDPS